MSQQTWSQVDEYVEGQLLAPDAVLAEALAASRAAGLPPINVAPTQGKLLMLLAQMQGAERILELGTLGGYSTIWLARALPRDGRLLTLELEPKHAAVAHANVARAGLSELVEIRVGPALDTLSAMVKGCEPKFDFVFIDADKQSIPEYLDLVLELTGPGSVIVVDNVIRGGQVVDPASTDPSVQGVRRFNAKLAGLPGVSATAVQTVGAKGYDGFALLRVNDGRL